MLAMSDGLFGLGTFGNSGSWKSANNMEEGSTDSFLHFRDFSPDPVAKVALNPPAIWLKPQSMIRECDMLRNRGYDSDLDDEITLALEDEENFVEPRSTLTLRLKQQGAKPKNCVEIPIVHVKSDKKDNCLIHSDDCLVLSDYDNLEDNDNFPVNELDTLNIGFIHPNETPPLHNPSIIRGKKGFKKVAIEQGLPVDLSSQRFFSNVTCRPQQKLSSQQDMYVCLSEKDDIEIIDIVNGAKPQQKNKDWLSESDYVVVDADRPVVDQTNDVGNNNRDLSKAPVKHSRLTSPQLIQEIARELDGLPKRNVDIQDRIIGKNDGKVDKCLDASVMVVETTKGEVMRHKPRFLKQIQEDILSSDMLSDEAINLGQNLLHSQFPEISGLEDTSLGAVYNFSVCRDKPFVQILHDMSCHWVCVSNIGCNANVVNLYDTLFYGVVKPAIQKQITCIMKPWGKRLRIKVQPIQRQQNSTDCGVFALAFATSLLNGQDPTDLVYDVAQLRPHLLDCLQKGKMLPFPMLCEGGENRSELHSLVEHIAPSVIDVQLVCSCRAPFNPKDDLVSCKKCRVLYHMGCANVPIEVLQLDIDWKCPSCRISQ